jgi:hypothetical protein
VSPDLIAGGVGNIAAACAQGTDPDGAAADRWRPGMRSGWAAARRRPWRPAPTRPISISIRQRGNAEIQRRAQEVIDRAGN